MTDERYKLTLFGVPRLLDPSGRDVTPRMTKTQALLAYLAVAEGREVQRATLQALLWSDRSPEHGRDSLKKALADLRTAFAGAPDPPLRTSGGPVRLDLTRVEVDLFRDTSAAPLFQPEFLAGIEIADPAFRHWLAEIRARLADRPHAALSLPREAPAPQPLFEVGLLPPEVAPGDGWAAGLADLLLDGFIALLDQSGVTRIYDFRQRPRLPVRGDRSPDVWMRLQVSSLGGEILVRTQFRHLGTDRVIFGDARRAARAEVGPDWIEAWVTRVFDHSFERLARFDGFAAEDHRAARLVFTAVDHLFRLTHADIDAAQRSLDEAAQLAQTGTIYAWNAYLTAFRAEKDGCGQAPELLERARWLSARALELDRHNPLCLALVAHVYSFVLRDLHRARDLLAPVKDDASGSALLSDTLSTLSLYTGDYAGARDHARRALAVGRFNPFRYGFTTALAMSELMLGRPREALAACREALAQHPLRDGHLYEPVLRTMAAAAGLVGAHEVGRQAVIRLSTQNGYDVRERLAQPDGPFPNPDVLKVVRHGVERLYG